MNKQAYQVKVGDLQGFAVDVKKDCPHASQHVQAQLVLAKAKGITKVPCQDCKDTSENWVCLECGAVCCSRYINKHMAAHFEQAKHPIVMSFSDLSFWCFECGDYIEHACLEKVHREVYLDKFGVYPEDYKQQEAADAILMDYVASEFEKLTLQERANAIEKVAAKIKTCKKIVVRKFIINYQKVLTGAGLSTAAGIPDFRSPGTGLYDNLAKYNLPQPMAIFEIGFFKKNPQPFFHLCKECFVQDYNPTKCHYFIKLLEQKNHLSVNLTQNIDALEFKAGISRDKVVMAHGTYETATCQKCSKSYSNDFIKQALHSSDTEVVVPKCSCGGVVKPDVVFFGEALPQSFMSTCMSTVIKADMLIVIGTSLAVYPVAGIVDMVPIGIPRVLINRERSGPFLENFATEFEDIYIGGDIEQAAMDLAEQLGWKSELEAEYNKK